MNGRLAHLQRMRALTVTPGGLTRWKVLLEIVGGQPVRAAVDIISDASDSARIAIAGGFTFALAMQWVTMLLVQ